jgi:hypothetical protein
MNVDHNGNEGGSPGAEPIDDATMAEDLDEGLFGDGSPDGEDVLATPGPAGAQDDEQEVMQEEVHEDGEEEVHEDDQEEVHENDQEETHENDQEELHEDDQEEAPENDQEETHENDQEETHENDQEETHENDQEEVHEEVHENDQDAVQYDSQEDAPGVRDDAHDECQDHIPDDVQEDDPDTGFQNVTGDFDADMEQDDEDVQDIVQDVIYETIEQDIDPVPPGASITDDEEEAEEQDDDTMHDAQMESKDHTDAHSHETTEPQNDTEAMQGIQEESTTYAQSDMVGEQSQPQPGFHFQSAHVDDEQLDNDSATLFVPEQTLPAPQPPTCEGTSVRMGPPPRPAKIATVAGISTFAKIRNMQNRLAQKKNAANVPQRYTADPDNEAYLEAVMSPITPSSSTPRPAVDEDELAERQAQADYQRQVRHYAELKRKNGTLSFREDVEYMKIKGTWEARRKKRERDLLKAKEDQEGDPDLFPEVRPRSVEDDDNDDDGTADDAFSFEDATASRKRRRRDMPRKEPKVMSMQEAELQSMKVALEAHDDMPKKKRKGPAADEDSQDTTTGGKGKGKGAKPKPRPSRAKGAAKPAAKGGRKTAKNKREVDHAVRQATSLFSSNVFEQQAGAYENEQPTFRARNKQDALKELIASVPLEDKKQARSEMAALLAATKDFDGHGSVKPSGGNWMVKGMKTSLKAYQILGSAFMRRRENAMEEPKGGLMADQMGLGEQESCKTGLILY